MYYEHFEEVVNRIGRSVICMDGAWWYVDEVIREPLGFNGYELPMTRDSHIKNVPLGKIETIVDLGYVNLEDFRKFSGALYVERTPARSPRQGLTSNNTSLRYPSLMKESPATFNITVERLVTLHASSGAFIDMVTGKYPSLEECLEKLALGRAGSWAFSPHFAVVSDDFRGDFVLDYRGSACGWFTKTNEVSLTKNFEYLKESLHDLNILAKGL
jgi:hypothetical protein